MYEPGLSISLSALGHQTKALPPCSVHVYRVFRRALIDADSGYLTKPAAYSCGLHMSGCRGNPSALVFVDARDCTSAGAP